MEPVEHDGLSKPVWTHPGSGRFEDHIDSQNYYIGCKGKGSETTGVNSSGFMGSSAGGVSQWNMLNKTLREISMNHLLFLREMYRQSGSLSNQESRYVYIIVKDRQLF